MSAEIEIRETDFSVEEEYRALRQRSPGCGACVLFTGLVREIGDEQGIEALELEHYPGMTEQSIAAIVEEARRRWPIAAVRVIHRVGRLVASEQIVLVAVSSAHRGAAFAACEFVMDYLKTRAPIWKKEIGNRQQRWVDSKESDATSAARWVRPDASAED